MTMDSDQQSPDEAPSSLRVLSRRPPPMSGWRSADTVRRTAVRRRRTKWGTGAAAVLAVAVAAALSLNSGSSSSTASPTARLSGAVHTVDGPNGSVQLVADTQPITSADAASVDAVVSAEQRLSLELLKQVGDGSNVTVSPASLYLALGMLQSGARGSTADEISKALQADGLSTDEQNAGLAAWAADLAAAAKRDGIELESANSLWQQTGFPIKPEFLKALAAYYDNGIWQVDFAERMNDALAAIDAWTSDHTHGKITKLFDQLDPDTVLVLANAVYFHAPWQTQFLGSATEPGTFWSAPDRMVSVTYMSGGAGLTSSVTDDYKAVQLPYAGGRFAALAVMPTRTSLTDYVDSLTPADIDAIAAGTRSGTSVAIPRFTTTSKIDLVPALQALGMHQAFAGGDLSGLSRVPTLVGQVIQRDYLQVGEHGTIAAAVTGIGVTAMSAHVGPDLVIDHPFLFLIRDTETGAILFASEITDPSV